MSSDALDSTSFSSGAAEDSQLPPVNRTWSLMVESFHGRMPPHRR